MPMSYEAITTQMRLQNIVPKVIDSNLPPSRRTKLSLRLGGTMISEESSAQGPYRIPASTFTGPLWTPSSSTQTLFARNGGLTPTACRDAAAGVFDRFIELSDKEKTGPACTILHCKSMNTVHHRSSWMGVGADAWPHHDQELGALD